MRLRRSWEEGRDKCCHKPRKLVQQHLEFNVGYVRISIVSSSSIFILSKYVLVCLNFCVLSGEK